MGASSELSLSCISLSGESSKCAQAYLNKTSLCYMFYSFVVCGVNEAVRQEIKDWSSEQPILSSAHPKVPGAAQFQSLDCVRPQFCLVRLLRNDHSVIPHISPFWCPCPCFFFFFSGMLIMFFWVTSEQHRQCLPRWNFKTFSPAQ